MQLELAIARSCSPQALRVRIAGAPDDIDAVYGPRVLDRIKIRPGDLIAVDLSANPPEAVWRWWHGEVGAIDGAEATVRRKITAADDGIATATVRVLIDGDAGACSPGDTVYFAGHPGPVVAVAEGTGVRDADAVAARLVPGVLAAYRAM